MNVCWSVCVSVCGMMRVQVKNTCEECVELVLFGAFSPSSYDEDREVLNVSKQFLRWIGKLWTTDDDQRWRRIIIVIINLLSSCDLGRDPFTIYPDFDTHLPSNVQVFLLLMMMMMLAMLVLESRWCCCCFCCCTLIFTFSSQFTFPHFLSLSIYIYKMRWWIFARTFRRCSYVQSTYFC